MKYNIEDYIGKKVWHLTVVSKDERSSKWLFECVCGKKILEYPSRVIPGDVRSCGCARHARIGKSRLKTVYKSQYYSTWHSMMNRCYRKDHASYKNYGGKGVSVCEEWKDPKKFIEWAEKTNGAEKNELTLDRIDNSLPYSPDNCRWATRTEQTRNRGRTIFWEIDGVKKPLGEWCQMYNIDYNVVRARYNKCKWDKIRCLTTPVKGRK